MQWFCESARYITEPSFRATNAAGLFRRASAMLGLLYVLPQPAKLVVVLSVTRKHQNTTYMHTDRNTHRITVKEYTEDSLFTTLMRWLYVSATKMLSPTPTIWPGSLNYRISKHDR